MSDSTNEKAFYRKACAHEKENDFEKAMESL